MLLRRIPLQKVAGATTILREGFHITGDDQSSLGTGFLLFPGGRAIAYHEDPGGKAPECYVYNRLFICPRRLFEGVLKTSSCQAAKLPICQAV